MTAPASMTGGACPRAALPDLSLPGAAESVHSAEFDTCSMLIKACAAAVGWTDAEGYTPLMLAAWHG